jgi:hypothetical protein
MDTAYLIPENNKFQAVALVYNPFSINDVLIEAFHTSTVSKLDMFVAAMISLDLIMPSISLGMVPGIAARWSV